MKQKTGISWFSIRLSLLLLLIAVPLWLSAQEGYNGGMRMNRDSTLFTPKGIELSPLDIFPNKATEKSLYPPIQVNRIPDFSLKGDLYLPYQINPSLLFEGDYRTSGVLNQFSHGILYGSGGQTSIPGIGRFNDASLSYEHLFSEKLSLQLSVNALKVNMTHITGQAFSASGAFLYRPSERVSLKFFGSYDLGNSYGMSTHSYGATVGFDMTERFSLEMGVQRYYNAMSGRWETVPVMIPYYRFEKFTLGLDVGGIIYEILRETVFDKKGSRGAPTIGPPRFSMPPIR